MTGRRGGTTRMRRIGGVRRTSGGIRRTSARR
jgi:hypothetical protein